ncbi:carbonic anhydrase 1-like [Oratosquilla oratoria]|uniref:carbonic anhydrase 1-like n=1 Tax=Oratosquilla oratoria TaxID=337810 RepID=UPI003F7633D6
MATRFAVLWTSSPETSCPRIVEKIRPPSFNRQAPIDPPDLWREIRGSQAIRRIRATGSDDWSYQGETGPDTWADNYPGCAGPLQTPIDLPAAENLTPIGKKPLLLKGYNKKPKNQYLYHDGWSVYVYAEFVPAKLLGTYEEQPSMSGGLLDDTYKFVQLHFHWAESNNLGSEHTVNGEASPLEIHFVHASDAGALAVLGVMTYIDAERPRESVLFPLWKCFVGMEKKGDKCPLRKRDAIVIENLLPSETSRFYRYLGSTTTPPCLANVTWTVFEDKLPISAVDVGLLRNWVGNDGNLLLNNYRPIQDTENREILLVTQ